MTHIDHLHRTSRPLAGPALPWLLALCCWSPAQAQAPARLEPTLHPQHQRITDRAIHADHLTYQQQQAAIQALNDSGRHRVASYSLAKAQCWLDVSFHEYSRNDRSPFPQAALSESFRITQYLAQGGAEADAANPALETPLVNQATRLRPDLWEQAAQLKRHAGFRCAEQRVACAEVELVHAGNEFDQQQWRHAKPYVQLAEDQLAEAAQAVQACLPPAPPPPPAPRPPPPVVAAPPPAPAVAPPPVPVLRQAQVLFNFDQRELSQVRPFSKASLDRLLADIRSGSWTATRIILVGHADISKNEAVKGYNDQLAEDRAKAIHDYLVSQGINPALIVTSAMSDGMQVVSCDRRHLSRPAYEECLLPNRRVDVQVEGFAPGR